MTHPLEWRESRVGWSLPLMAVIIASGWSITGSRSSSLYKVDTMSHINRNRQRRTAISETQPISTKTELDKPNSIDTNIVCMWGVVKWSETKKRGIWSPATANQRVLIFFVLWPLDRPPHVHGRHRGLPQPDQAGQDWDREQPCGGWGGIQQVRQLPQLLRSVYWDTDMI